MPGSRIVQLPQITLYVMTSSLRSPIAADIDLKRVTRMLDEDTMLRTLVEDHLVISLFSDVTIANHDDENEPVAHIINPAGPIEEVTRI